MVELLQDEKLIIIQKAKEEILASSVLNKKQKALLVFYLGLAIVSVIPNFLYGAGFSQDVARKIDPDLQNNSTAIEGIRLPFATVSGVVNGIINTRSFHFAFATIASELLDIYNTIENGPLAKAIFTLIAKLGFITAAAVPNWQIVKDGAINADVNWSPDLLKAIQITVCGGAAALVFRGIKGVANNFTYSPYARIFPPLRLQQDEAAAIKLQLLRELVPHLSEDQLIELSKGYRYQGPSFLTQFLIKTIFFVAPALFYTFAAYWGSSDEAMVNFENIGNHPNFWQQALRYTVDSAATIGRGLVLGNVAALIADNLLHCRSHDMLTNTLVPLTICDIVTNTIIYLITAVSLTGAMGLVYEYLFHNSDNLLDLMGSVAICLVGAGAINFGDIKTLYNGIRNAKTLLFGSSNELPEPENTQIAAEIVGWHPTKVLKEKDAILASRVGLHGSMRPLQPVSDRTPLLINDDPRLRQSYLSSGSFA